MIGWSTYWTFFSPLAGIMGSFTISGSTKVMSKLFKQSRLIFLDRAWGPPRLANLRNWGESAPSLQAASAASLTMGKDIVPHDTHSSKRLANADDSL